MPPFVSHFFSAVTLIRTQLHDNRDTFFSLYYQDPYDIISVSNSPVLILTI